MFYCGKRYIHKCMKGVCVHILKDMAPLLMGLTLLCNKTDLHSTVFECSEGVFMACISRGSSNAGEQGSVSKGCMNGYMVTNIWSSTCIHHREVISKKCDYSEVSRDD